MSGETPGLSGGIGGGAGPGGGAAAGGVGAGGTGAGAGAAGGAGGAGAGGFGGIGGGQLAPILIAGGLSGVIVMGALIALSIVPVHSGGSGASPRGLVLVACPDSGPVLAVVDPGQKLLVTGRSSDGAWLQVYLPGPALPYAWVPASELQPSGDTGTLPVAACEVAAASPSGTPIVAVVSPIPTPTPTPTLAPTLAPTPSPTPTNSSPVIANLAAAPGAVYYPWGSIGALKCGPDAKDPDTTTISATITDPQGVASATIFYKWPNRAYASKAMTHAGSTYSATFKIPSGFNDRGNLNYYIVSKDKSPAGKTRTSPLKSVSVRKCDIPPRVTSASQKPTSTFQVPLKNGPACTNSNNWIMITASASDSDGSIAKVVFYYHPYPSATSKLQSLALASSPLTSAWAAKLDNTKFPRLPKKNSYAFSGYVVATDDAGRASAKYTVTGLIESSC